MTDVIVLGTRMCTWGFQDAGAREGGDGDGGDLAAALMGDGGGNPLNFMRFHPQFEQVILLRLPPVSLVRYTAGFS